MTTTQHTAKMKEYFRCWKCNDNKRYTKQELLKRTEEKKKHIDYCCPRCEAVIICCNTTTQQQNSKEKSFTIKENSGGVKNLTQHNNNTAKEFKIIEKIKDKINFQKSLMGLLGGFNPNDTLREIDRLTKEYK